MMKQELERQKATLQQEIEELKKKEISEDHMEKNVQSKGTCGRYMYISYGLI